jgi:hypothetical protein
VLTQRLEELSRRIEALTAAVHQRLVDHEAGGGGRPRRPR